MTVRVLFLTFYFPPDLSAGSFRATALVDALLEQGSAQLHLEVLTTHPNRYGTFVMDAPAEELRDRLRLTRIKVPVHRGGMTDQAASFLAYARAVRRITSDRRYDLVFATSSRLMTAALAASVARRTRSRLYLDIRDIFVDTIGDVLPAAAASVLKPPFRLVERWTIAAADCVNLVSPGFEPYFASRYSARTYSKITNGIDDAFLGSVVGRPSKSALPDRRPRRVVYAGNIGEGQGLHSILPELARRLAGRATFRIIGDGGRRRQLEDAIARARVDNVQLLAPIPRDRLVEEYREADVLFLHLNDRQAFEKVLPSKIFEYGAMQKPIWAGVAGYAARFLRDELAGSEIFKPCDIADAVAAFDRLSTVMATPSDFVARYRRGTLMRQMAVDILSCAGVPARE